MHDDIGDVAVHEELARGEVDDLVGRHAAVRASDPEVARSLLPRQSGEEIGIASSDALGPRAVVFEEVRKRAHGQPGLREHSTAGALIPTNTSAGLCRAPHGLEKRGLPRAYSYEQCHVIALSKRQPRVDIVPLGVSGHELLDVTQQHNLGFRGQAHAYEAHRLTGSVEPVPEKIGRVRLHEAHDRPIRDPGERPRDTKSNAIILMQIEQSDTLQTQQQPNALRLVEREKLHDLADAKLRNAQIARAISLRFSRQRVVRPRIRARG